MSESESNSKAHTARTIAHYERSAAAFEEGTRSHDVTQNYAALLDAIARVFRGPRYTVLDLGCGPGRDVAWFSAAGHEAVGLDGTEAFVKRVREATGCEALLQDFVALTLPAARFHGIFANASLFHVPRVDLPRVLRELFATLQPGGVLFSSNPHGDDQESTDERGRYCLFQTHAAWTALGADAGFVEESHYYRPTGKPRSEQPWLATVWRKPV